MARTKKLRCFKGDGVSVAITYHGPLAIAYKYNSEEVAGCVSTAGCNATQQLITNYQSLGSVDGLYDGSVPFSPYPQDNPDGNDDDDFVEETSLFVRLCCAGYIGGRLIVGGTDMSTETVVVPAGAPDGQRRVINEGSVLFTMIDVHETVGEDGVDPRYTKFDFQTDRNIEGYNTFFFLHSTLTPQDADPDVSHQQHVYSVRRTTLTQLPQHEAPGEFHGYLIDGGEKGAKCHFILEDEFKYFMFDQEGRACLNRNLSVVFPDQTVFLRYITMPLIQTREPFVWPIDNPDVVRNRMIVKHLSEVNEDFSETHAGIILRDGKEGVVNWIRRI